MALVAQWVPVLTASGRVRLEMRWRVPAAPAPATVEPVTTGAEFAPAA